MVFVPFIASAQTINTPNDALISALTQLISLLTQEVQLLEQQLALTQATTTPVTLGVPQAQSLDVQATINSPAPVVQYVYIPQILPSDVIRVATTPPTPVATFTPPSSPTCTMTNEGVPKSSPNDLFSTYLDYTKSDGSYGSITPTNLVNGKNAVLQFNTGNALTGAISTSTTYTLTLQDSYGQTGSCSTNVVLPQKVCVQTNTINGIVCSYPN